MAVAVAFVLACRADESPPERQRPEAPEGARLRWVNAFPALVGTSTGPAVFAAAGRRWRTATVAFSLGDLDTSATAFGDVADTLRRSAAEYPEHAGAFRAARCMAYQNIGAIFRYLPNPDEGRARLRRAQVEDPECAESIGLALTRFDESAAAPDPMDGIKAFDASVPQPPPLSDPPADG